MTAITAPAIVAPEQLKREIGASGLALAIVNIAIGSGIFALPAIVADGLGAAAVIAYLICGLIIFLIAICFAEVGSNTSKSGGAYMYIEETFGPYAGFLAANIFVLGGCMASDAAIANAMADTLRSFFPELSVDMNRIIFMAIIFAALAWLNISSVKNGIRFVVISGTIKMTALILLVVTAIPHIDKVNLKWVIQPSLGNMGSATLLLFFAFQGFEVPLSNGGEIRSPSRTVPLGIFWGVTALLLVYISVQLVAQGTLGIHLSDNKTAPLSVVAGIALGKPGMTFIIIVTILSIFGSLSGAVLATPRILYAGARDRLLPAALARVHPRFNTPHIAIIAYVAMDFIMAISGGFRQLAIISSVSALLLYLGVVLACIKQKRKNPAGSVKGFRIPGGITVPLLAVAAIIWLFAHLSMNEWTSICIFIALFSLIYLCIKIIKKKNPENSNS